MKRQPALPRKCRVNDPCRTDSGQASFGQIDCAKLQRAKNFLGRQYQAAQRFRNHTDIYTSLSRKLSLASRSFYFRTEQSNDVFQVKYLSHVEYALEDFAVCWAPAHLNIIDCLTLEGYFTGPALRLTQINLWRRPRHRCYSLHNCGRRQVRWALGWSEFCNGSYERGPAFAGAIASAPTLRYSALELGAVLCSAYDQSGY
jgi:hypothetical protein